MAIGATRKMRKTIIGLISVFIIGAAAMALLLYASPKNTVEYLPVLYYHAVNDTITGIEDLFVSPSEFERQMEYLKKNKYTVITFDQIHNYKKIKKPVMITFDDGYEDNYTNAYPILKKYGHKASVFLCTDFIDKPLYLKTKQILAMKDLINFQSHTLSHRNLTELDEEQIEHELMNSRFLLEDMLGEKVEALAYPFGDYDERVLGIALKYYRYAVLNGEGLYSEKDSDLEIRRLYIPRSMSFQEFKELIK